MVGQPDGGGGLGLARRDGGIIGQAAQTDGWGQGRVGASRQPRARSCDGEDH
jgi:hypothetical protein